MTNIIPWHVLKWCSHKFLYRPMPAISYAVKEMPWSGNYVELFRDMAGGKIQWGGKSIKIAHRTENFSELRKLTLEMFNIEANRWDRNCFPIIFVLEKAHNGRFSRVIQSNDKNADLFASSVFGENLHEHSSKHHCRSNLCLLGRRPFPLSVTLELFRMFIYELPESIQ